MRFNDAIVRLGTVTSTMDEARTRAQAGAPHGTCVMAACQTQGRGRRGRSWVSAQGAGLWLTVLLRPPPHTDLRGLTLVVGGAVLTAAHFLGAHEARIKWPNDIWVHGHKLAGILAEALPPDPGRDGVGAVLVGVGMNLAAGAPQEFGQQAADPARAPYMGLGSLCPAATLPDVTTCVIDAIQDAYERWLTDGMAPTLNLFERFDALKGAQVHAQDPSGRAILGEVVGIDADGGLVLCVQGTPTTVYAGEVACVRRL